MSFDFSTSLREIWGDLVWPLILIGISMALIFKQPDLGTAILVMGIFLVMLYASGIALRLYRGLAGYFGIADALGLACFKTVPEGQAVGLS